MIQLQLNYSNMAEEEISNRINEFVLREGLNNLNFRFDVCDTIIIKKNYIDNDTLIVTINIIKSV